MDVLESKIDELIDLRDGFFEKFPTGTEDERVKTVREKALLLLEDVPLSGPRSPVRYLQCGRILNACVAYDPRCEELLSKAVKLDPDAVSWLELGICLSKKPDIQFAIECLQCSLDLERTSRALCTLSMLLRAKMMKTVDLAERTLLQKQSTLLAVEAVELDPSSGTAHSCLGNSLFLEFFNTGQTNANLLDLAKPWKPMLDGSLLLMHKTTPGYPLNISTFKCNRLCAQLRECQKGFLVHWIYSIPFQKQACDEYRLALQCGKEYRNADLHLNAGAAFRYEENYTEALKQLRLAVKYDPNNVIGSQGRLSSLTKFLTELTASVQNSGGLRAKRITEFKTSLQSSSSSMNPFADLRPVVTAKDLAEGVNAGVVVIGRIVSTIPHEEIVPICLIMMDANGDCVAVCVYNCAPSLAFCVGDTVAVAEPFVVDVEKLDLASLPGASFRSLRISNPSRISRNGVLPKPAQLVPSHLKISAL